MSRRILAAILLLPGMTTFAQAADGALCDVTKAVLATPPPDDAVRGPPAQGYYYVNANRTMWAVAPPSDGGLTAGGTGHKFPWFRPAGATLAITGRRLDGAASPLEASVPCCYPTRFQSSAVRFPEAGCWAIVGRAGNQELRFVVLVAPEPSA